MGCTGDRLTLRQKLTYYASLVEKRDRPSKHRESDRACCRGEAFGRQLNGINLNFCIRMLRPQGLQTTPNVSVQMLTAIAGQGEAFG